jgi:hypothetical protein
MVSDLAEVFNQSDLIVVSKKTPQFVDALAKKMDGKAMIDLVRLWPELAGGKPKYEGICW